MAWVAETADPQAWDQTYFSNIVYESGYWVVYVGGYNIAKFYRYNLDTNVFTELTDPPAVLYGQLAVSPDGTKVAGHGVNGTVLYIYDISSQGWTTSPDNPGGWEIQSLCFVDNDTVWAQVRSFPEKVKFYKYTVSTDTWTSYSNSRSVDYGNSYSMCISTDGTKLYAGKCGANYRETTKYTIATDTYAGGPTIPSTYRFVMAADRNKLWYGPRRSVPVTHGTITRWVNPDTEVQEVGVFSEYDPATVIGLTAGVYGVTMCIAGLMLAAPENLSETLAVLATVTTDAASSIEKEQAALNGTLDNDGGDTCECGFEWGETDAYGNTTPTQSKTTGQTFSQQITGLDPNKTYHFRAFATNPAGTSHGADRTFKTLVSAPAVTTNLATGLGAVSATLNGTLDDDIGEACECGFEWGETIAYGNTTPTQSRTTGQTFAQTISGLDPKKTYHFRALATNSAGTGHGTDRTFTTSAVAPTVATNPAIDINNISATLKGELTYDGGEACNCGFEYGETDAYGTTTPTQSKVTGEAFSQPISGLDPDKTYHFRSIATNSAGTSHGADRTFKTLVSAPAVTTNLATGLGAVSATLNGTLDADIGEACECGFEWGLDTDYGITTPTETKTAVNTFSQPIHGLFPNTTYHFRAFATNSFGTGYGAARTFTTALVVSRAYALAREEL